MNRIRRYRTRFTLIELLAVVALISLLMAIGVPAFSRMIRGNRVDESARSIKLAMEQAQMRAASERCYVAVIFPNGQVDESLDPYRLGGFRLAYVKKQADASYAFSRWVDGGGWSNAFGGAMLAKVAVDADDVDPDSKGAVSGCTKKTNSAVAGSGNLKALQSIKDDKGNDLACGENCALIFKSYGGTVSSSKLYFLVSETTLGKELFKANAPNEKDGQEIIYPSTGESDKTTNFRVLKVNNLTGRVEFYE